MDTFLKIIKAIFIAIGIIILLPIAVITGIWLIKFIAGLSITGFLTIALIGLIVYIIWG